MADTTSTNLAGLFAKVYEDTRLVARAANVMPNVVSVMSERQGIEDRIFSQHAEATAAAVAEGTDLAPTTLTKAATATLTPGEVGAQYTITDRARRTDPAIWAKAAKSLGNAMGEKLDKDLCSSFASFTGGSVGTAGGATPNTFRHLFAGKSILDAAGLGGDYFAVLHTYQWFQMGNSVSLEQSLKNTPEVIRDELARKWYVGSVAGIHILVTPHVPIATNDATGGLFPSEALALDIRSPMTIEPFRSPKGRKTELNLVMDYAYGAAYPAYGVKIVGQATTPT